MSLNNCLVMKFLASENSRDGEVGVYRVRLQVVAKNMLRILARRHQPSSTLIGQSS